MSLTATQPSQELLDGLSLDAAWDHAKYLEGEVTRLRKLSKANYELWNDELVKRIRLENGIAGIVEEYSSNPGKAKRLDEYIAELNELLAGKPK